MIRSLSGPVIIVKLRVEQLVEVEIEKEIEYEVFEKTLKPEETINQTLTKRAFIKISLPQR